MDKDWILTFAFFMIFNNSPEIMELLRSENFDEDFVKSLNELENEDSEKLKALIINKIKENEDKFKSLNETFKLRNDVGNIQ